MNEEPAFKESKVSQPWVRDERRIHRQVDFETSTWICSHSRSFTELNVLLNLLPLTSRDSVEHPPHLEIRVVYAAASTSLKEPPAAKSPVMSPTCATTLTISEYGPSNVEPWLLGLHQHRSAVGIHLFKRHREAWKVFSSSSSINCCIEPYTNLKSLTFLKLR